MRDGDGLDERRAMLSVRRMLLDCLGNEQLDGRARLQLGILQRLHGDVREREEGVAFLLELVAFPDAGIAGRACAELGLAGCKGRVRASRAASPPSNGPTEPSRCSRMILSSNRYARRY